MLCTEKSPIWFVIHKSPNSVLSCIAALTWYYSVLPWEICHLSPIGPQIVYYHVLLPWLDITQCCHGKSAIWFVIHRPTKLIVYYYLFIALIQYQLTFNLQKPTCDILWWSWFDKWVNNTKYHVMEKFCILLIIT